MFGVQCARRFPPGPGCDGCILTLTDAAGVVYFCLPGNAGPAEAVGR